MGSRPAPPPRPPPADWPTMTGLRFHDRRASLPFLAAAPLSLHIAVGREQPQAAACRPPTMVSVAQVKRANVPYVIEANGIVTPVNSANVLAQVDGLIQSVDFNEGDEVQAGQALFHIDQRPYKNAYEQAQAVLERDSVNAVRARAEYDRYVKLLAAKVITEQEASQYTTSAATRDATVRGDRAAVAQAKFNLDNTVIRAPISGKTGSLLVKQGNLVRAGGPTLVGINQVRPILVRFAIPSSQLPLLLQYGARGGLPVAAVPGGVAPGTLSIDSITAATLVVAGESPGQPAPRGGGSQSGAGGMPNSGRATPDGGAVPNGTGGPSPQPGGRGGMEDEGAGRPSGGGGGMTDGGRGQANSGGGPVAQQGMKGFITGDRQFGKLSFIDNAVDTTTGMVQLKAQFDNMAGRLWVGQFASTSLHLFDQDSPLVIPSEALVIGQSGAYVYVVDRADTARRRAVT